MPDTTLQSLSGAIDELFRPVSRPLGQVFGATAGGLASVLDPSRQNIWREQATRVGEGLPRFTAEAALYGAKRIPFKALGLGDVALRSYTQPGADLEGTLASTAAFATSPFASRVGSRMASMVAPKVQQAFTSPGARYLAGQAVERSGGLAGAIVPFEAANALEAYNRGEAYRPLSPENVIGTAASVLPFEAMHIPGIVRGYKQATSPLVNQVPVSDQAESYRVHWDAHDEQRQRDFNDKQTAFDFADELRSKLGATPMVEPAGMVPRSYVTHQMAFKPEQLQAGMFGLKASEVLNDMPEREMPGTQMLGTLKNRVPKSEWEALPGLEDFLKGQKKVQPKMVQNWLEQNMPRVEVRKMGEGGQTPEQKEMVSIEHKLDTISPGWTYAKDEALSPEVKNIRDRYIELSKATQGQPTQQSHWQQISPKPESEMPGYVELAVVVPGAREFDDSGKAITRPSRDFPQNLFPSSHHFPPNTLGWSRGYMETLPNGKKVFHVIEVQSDWAHQVREIKESLKKEATDTTWEEEGVASRDYMVRKLEKNQHPLISQWERLVFKATIDHAIKNGADAVAVSDAETAMMTEGHDRTVNQHTGHVTTLNTRTEAEQFVNDAKLNHPNWEYEIVNNGNMWEVNLLRKNDRPSQEPGMRLHYDQTLPKTLRELTGEKGEKVSFGEHKMAFEPTTWETAQQGDIIGRSRTSEVRKNLIFRNPDGTPKTDASATSFSLSKTKTELTKRGGFPMFGSEKYVKQHSEQMLQEGYDPDQVAKAVENVKQLQPLPGESPMQTLARSVGIDPQLFQRLKPGEAMPKAFEFLTSMFHYNYGYEPNQAARLARQVMVPLSRFAPWLGQTSFAMSPAEESHSTMTGVKTAFSEAYQYLIRIHDFPKSQLAARQTPEMQIFEVARSLGHEAGHNALKEALNPIGLASPEQRRAAIRALVSVEAIAPGERRGVMESLMKLVVPPKKWSELSKVNMDTYETSPEEFLADFSSLISIGATDKKTLRNMQDALTFGDKASQDFSNAVYRDITSIWSGVKSWLSTFKPGREGKQIVKAVDGIYENMTKLMASRDKAEQMNDGFQALMQRQSQGPLDPPPIVTQGQLNSLFKSIDNLDLATFNSLKGLGKGHFQASMKVVDEALSWIRPYERPRVAGERLLWWKDYLKPMSQLVESLREKVPSAVPVKALGFDYRGMVSKAQTDTWKLWEPDVKPTTLQTLFGGIADWKRLRWLGKDGSAQERAFSTIALVENVRTQMEKADTHLTRDQREKLSPEYKSLSDEDKNKVDKSLEQAWAMTRLLARRQWDAHRDRVAWEMSKIIMSFNKSLFHDKAKDMADQAVHWVFDEPDDVDHLPPFLAQRDAFYASLPLPDVGKKTLEQKIRDNRGPWQKLGDNLLGKADTFTGERPGKLAYLPEVRVRDWHVAFKMSNEDVPHHEAYNTEAKAAQRLKEVNGKEGLEWVKTFNRKDRTERFRGAVQEEISSAQQNALDALLASVISGISSDHPEAQDIIAKIKSEFQPATAFANVTVSPYMREREFIPGREDLNMVEGLVRYVDAVSYQMAKRHVKQAGQAVLFNPDMRENPDIRNNFEKYLRFVTDAEGKEFNFLKNLVFFHYIGFNPATALVEPTQQLVTLAPYMIDNGMGVGETYKALRQSNMDILQYALSDLKLPDPIENKALTEAVKKRTVDTGFVSDLYGETDLDFAAQNSAVAGNDQLKDKIDLLRKPIYQMLAAARHIYGMVTSTNGKVAFLTAFRYEYGRSKDYDKAMRFATQATDATMYGGGKAARPMALQRFGSMSGVGGVMYTLGSYTLNTIAMMGRLTRKAILDSSLTPVEKNAATKAMAVMWATQFVFGGVLGLPLVAAGLAVLEQIFPGFNAMKYVRGASEHLGKFATGDEDMGHVVADGAMRGALNLVSPVDFGSRFQLGNLLGVSPYDGFSWSNLAGPAASMLGNYVKAAGQASTGHWGDAARTAAPVAVRQVANLVHDDWAVRDKAGRLVSELSPGEKLLATMGFKSKKFTNYYEEQHIRQRLEQYKAGEIRDIRSQAAKLLVQGDVQGARKVILQGVQDVGPYDPIDMAREAAQLAVEMQEPVERRRGTRATATDEADVSRLYPQTVGIGEVQRVLKQAAMTRQMGLAFGRPNLGELRTASVVDTLMKQDKSLSLSQARLKAEQMMSPTARRHSSIANLLQAQ